MYQYDYSDYPDLTPTAANVSDTVQTHAENPVHVEVNEDEKTVTYHWTADDTTNGLTSFAYDPEVLTFSDLTASMPYQSFRNDSETGKVTVAFADADEMQNATVNVTFTYEPTEKEQTTELTVTEQEKGDRKRSPCLPSS